MSSRGLRFRHFAAIALVVGALASCAWFPESTFTLSPESRLPRWIVLHGVPRSEVSVRLDYIASLAQPYARITVLDKHGRVIERLDADLTSSVGPLAADGTPSRGRFPSYDIAAVNGVIDIIEQRALEPTEYMCDDAAVWSKIAPRAAMPPNNAFERPVTRITSARGQRASYSAPATRLKARQPAAQRER